MIVVHPHHIVRPQQFFQIAGEKFIDPEIATEIAAGEFGEGEPVMQDRPQHTIGEAVVKFLVIVLAQTDGDVGDVVVLDRLGRSRIVFGNVPAPAEPDAAPPAPPPFGVGAKEIALVEMWNRRAEINFFSNVAAVFRHLHPAMKELEVPQLPAWAEANKPRVTWFLELLERELTKREFIAGDRYSVADITALVAVDFMKPARLAMPEGASNVKRWHAAVSARPSASA